MSERFVTVVGFARGARDAQAEWAPRLGMGGKLIHSWSCLEKAKISQAIMGGPGNCMIFRESTWKRLTGRA